MSIDYNHSENLHTLDGPRAALSVLFAGAKPSSLLDVGCGTGTWLKAAIDFGISEVSGVDGVAIPPDKLHVPVALIQHQDLTRPWDLGRRFDAALCLEVGEHLDKVHACTLADSLVKHSDRIYFSAACPGQPGQHHVNCQWPAYWQQLFNQRGFVCDDSLRWQIWNDVRIEPWYRQNTFLACRSSSKAGSEARIDPVIHPEMLPYLVAMNRNDASLTQIHQVERGGMPASWYISAPVTGLWSKLRRKFSTRA